MKIVSVTVPFPPSEREAAINFYRNQMGFEEVDGDFLIYPDNPNIKIQLKEHESIKVLNEKYRPAPLFMYSVTTNFLSYCLSLMKRGVVIEYAHSDPGGYYARVIDPFLNWIEITCDNWDDENQDIDPFNWPFYKRY